MDAQSKSTQSTQPNPTSFELASLAAILLTGARPIDSLDVAFEEAMQLYKAAQHRLTRKSLSDVEESKRLVTEWKAKQPRYRFAPHQATDEAREYLKNPVPSQRLGVSSLSALRNVSKGTTLEKKLRLYFADLRIVRRAAESAKKLEAELFGGCTWVGGKPTYALFGPELDKFRRWQMEVARIEALDRKGMPPTPLNIWARLRGASADIYIDPAFMKHKLVDDLGLVEAEKLSREIVSKLRSLSLSEKAKTAPPPPPD